MEEEEERTRAPTHGFQVATWMTTMERKSWEGASETEGGREGEGRRGRREEGEECTE